MRGQNYVSISISFNSDILLIVSRFSILKLKSDLETIKSQSINEEYILYMCILYDILYTTVYYCSDSARSWKFK